MKVKTDRSPLEALARKQAGYARWLHTKFSGKLCLEDAADCVQEALIRASNRDETDELAPPQLEAWLRSTAYRLAIDHLRKAHSDGRRHLHFDDLDSLEMSKDNSSGVEHLLDHDEQEKTIKLTQDLIGTLGNEQQRLLKLRYHRRLPVADCAEVLGLSRTKYERQHTSALQKLREVTILGKSGPDCIRARELLKLGSASDPRHENRAWLGLHLEVCHYCRAYDRRRKGLLSLYPLPAVGLVRQALVKIQGLFGGSSPVASNNIAVKSGGGGLSAVLSGTTAKTAAICVVAGAGTVGVVKDVKKPKPEQPVVSSVVAKASGGTVANTPSTVSSSQSRLLVTDTVKVPPSNAGVNRYFGEDELFENPFGDDGNDRPESDSQAESRTQAHKVKRRKRSKDSRYASPQRRSIAKSRPEGVSPPTRVDQSSSRKSSSKVNKSVAPSKETGEIDDWQ